MKKIKELLDLVLSKVVVAVMALMVINVLWQVFSRFILNDPSSFTEELARYLLIWVGLLGASYVSGQRLHLAIDLLGQKISGKKKIILGIFIESCVFLFAVVVMIIGGYKLASITLQLHQISAALQLPLGVVYSVVPVSGVFMAFYSFYFIVDYFKQLQTHNNN